MTQDKAHPTPPAVPRERTPKDYAIEHAEYMAAAGEHLIEAVNDLAKAEQERDEGTANPSDVQAAQDTLSEQLCTMRNRIYEFRKRRDRALAAPVASTSSAVPIEPRGCPTPGACSSIAAIAERAAVLEEAAQVALRLCDHRPPDQVADAIRRLAAPVASNTTAEPVKSGVEAYKRGWQAGWDDNKPAIWRAAFDEARDSILNERGPLEGMGLTGDQINAVLAILDDAEPAPIQPAGAEVPDWASCETRGPWVRNSLAARIGEMKSAEKRLRRSFNKPYMGEPTKWYADVVAEAARVLERAHAAIDQARAGGAAK